MTPAEAPRSTLWLALAVGGAVAAFVVGLALAAFLLRDAPPTGRIARPPPSTSLPSTATAGTRRPVPRPLERQSASTVIAPALPECFREARARDPSLADQVELVVTLDARPGTGSIGAVRLGRGSSPFLAACLRASLVGATFPAESDGAGDVAWRAAIVDGKGTLVEIAER